MSAAREARRDSLFDYAHASPDGFTVEDFMDYEGCTHPQANTAIRDLREWLADTGDTITLPCEPPSGGRRRWVYRLVGSLDDVKGWVANRVGDAESRVTTMQSVMATIVAGTDGRSVEGKKARLMDRYFTRLVEDLEDLSNGS